MRPVLPSRVSQKFANPGSYASDPDIHGRAGHHTGIDYGSAWPIPIYRRVVRTVVPGQVVISDYNTTMGHWVGVYNYDENLLVTYWHLSARAPKVGDWVQVYQVIGRVGNSGNSTASHLHVQVNRGDEFDYDGHLNPNEALTLFSRSEAKKVWKRSGKKHPNARG